MSGIPVEFEKFPCRADRIAYVARRYAERLQGRVLDVGCDEATLRNLIPGSDYTGVDVGGSPDIRLNLDLAERLPFEDGQFDCVLAVDVLEHLEHLHRMFEELVRVSRSRVILSLPNNWANARRPLQRGKGRIGHYGLPTEPPPDRHRWFFSFEEALEFLRAKERAGELRIAEMHAVEKPRPLPVRWLRRLRYPVQMRYLNRYATALWAVLEKPGT